MAGLRKYKEKRDFAQTPEPGGEQQSVHQNRFVVQKHEASHTHFDLRIQVGDVLLSWAIPKGPSANPEVRRLAMRTEDHPVEYLEFEGVIPEGNYGAGTMMVWDSGTYLPDGIDADDESEISRKIGKGSIKMFFEGQKLRGNYSLYLTSEKNGKEQWIFSKSKDKFAGEDEAFDQRSVLSGRTMEEISRGGTPHDTSTSLKTAGAKKTGFSEIKPMLATLGDEPFDNPEWIYEIKLDGYRIMGQHSAGNSHLVSRNGKYYDEKYAAVCEELNNIDRDFVIDGEVVVLNDEGRSDFGALQNLDKKSAGRLYFFAFDLLWLDGYLLTGVPLVKRKELLKGLLGNDLQRIKYLDHIDGKGTAFFTQAEKLDLEGIIAKRKKSKYYPGKRSDEWIKLKSVKQQEVVIVGYTPPKGSRKYFGSLVMAVNRDGGLYYAGRVGTGFDENLLEEIHRKMVPLETDTPTVEGKHPKNVQWVKPGLIAEVRFAEWTSAGSMRHPTFKGLRSDKEAEAVKQEKPEVNAEKLHVKVKLSNPGKIFWPEKKITKKDTYDYYADIAPLILPYLKDRPQSLYRTPDGITGSGFFQKDVSGLVPDWIETVEVVSSSSDERKTWMLCQNRETLLYMVNLGCVEINPWNASVPDLDKPDYVVFDLDPLEIEFSKVVKVALGFRELFNQLNLPFFCKTSGGRGLHIFLPILKNYSHEQAQQFARLIEMLIHQRFRSITSFERSPSKRKGKIYLDFLQNGRGKTMASVYSLRPKEGAGVSTPLHEDELTKDFDPAAFNIFTVRERFEQKGDLWKDLFKRRVDISEVLNKLENLK